MSTTERTQPTRTDDGTVRRASWAGLVGTALEQYDFVIYGTASAIVFPELFFPEASPAAGTIASFSTYAVGFAARPVGGFLFSLVGDRWGRKFVLVATLFLMGFATLAIGLLPTYAQVGVWAPTLLVACRLLQGLGAGAEQAGGIVLITETAPKGARGRLASLVYVGAAAGTALGALVWLLVQRLPEADVESYGWRLVFLSSIVVTAAAYIIRRRLRESPVFQDVRDKVEAVPQVPVSDVVAHGRRPLAQVFFMNIGGNTHSYIFQVFLAAYLIDTVGVEESLIPKVLLAGALAACVAAYAAGRLTDRFGRRRVFLVIAIFLILFTVPGLAMITTGNTALVYLVVIVGFIFAAYGTVGSQAAWFPELFGSRYRYAGVALGREFSSVIGGGISPLVCASLVAWASDGWWPVAVYMIALMAISLVAAWLSPETRDRDLRTQSDAN